MARVWVIRSHGSILVIFSSQKVWVMKRCMGFDWGRFVWIFLSKQNFGTICPNHCQCIRLSGLGLNRPVIRCQWLDVVRQCEGTLNSLIRLDKEYRCRPSLQSQTSIISVSAHMSLFWLLSASWAHWCTSLSKSNDFYKKEAFFY